MKGIKIILIVISMSVLSCKKEAGVGGTSTITGKVYVKNYNVNGNILQSEYYGPEEKVYLVYGNHSVYDDWMRTGYDGTYQFSYLFPGDYRIYAYSRCDTCQSGVEAIIQQITISSNHQLIEVPDIIIKK